MGAECKLQCFTADSRTCWPLVTSADQRSADAVLLKVFDCLLHKPDLATAACRCKYGCGCRYKHGCKWRWLWVLLAVSLWVLLQCCLPVGVRPNACGNGDFRSEASSSNLPAPALLEPAIVWVSPVVSIAVGAPPGWRPCHRIPFGSLCHAASRQLAGSGAPKQANSCVGTETDQQQQLRRESGTVSGVSALQFDKGHLRRRSCQLHWRRPP